MTHRSRFTFFRSATTLTALSAIAAVGCSSNSDTTDPVASQHSSTGAAAGSSGSGAGGNVAGGGKAGAGGGNAGVGGSVIIGSAGASGSVNVGGSAGVGGSVGVGGGGGSFSVGGSGGGSSVGGSSVGGSGSSVGGSSGGFGPGGGGFAGGFVGGGGISATGGFSGSGSSVGGSGGTPPVPCTATSCASPPPDPGAGPGDGVGSNVQAFDKLFMGETDRQGNWTSDAWQLYGFPISGVIYKDAKGGVATHCKPQDGAKPADVIVNGTNGVDNSFGKNVWPIFLGIASDASQKITDGLNAGGFSMVVSIDALGSNPSYSGLSAKVFSVQGTLDATGVPVPPGVDWASYVWHPFATAPDGSAFPTSYLANQTWVSGQKTDVPVFISFSGFDLPLNIHYATLAMKFSADHATSTNGNIGGVLLTEELVTAFKAIAGKVSTSLCMGTALDGVSQQIRQASDIGHDGTQDPTMVCDGVSIGLGFETRASTLGDTAPPLVTKDPCAP